MTDSSRRPELLAADGLRARDNGEWAVQKLDFINTFGPVALLATASKHTRWYVDLFAGPGMNKLRGGAGETDGSPLRAIELVAQDDVQTAFTDAVFVNRDARDDTALRERVRRREADGRCRVPIERIEFRRKDANKEVHSIMQGIHPRGYVFVFADIESPTQLPWTSIEALKSQGHESVDLYLLFPLDMALKRLLSSNPRTVEQCASVLTAFYGGDDWRPLLKHREGSARDLGAAAQQLYMNKLSRLWKYVGEVCDVRRGENHRLYKMLYASKDPAGQRIAKWAAKRNAPPSLFD